MDWDWSNIYSGSFKNFEIKMNVINVPLLPTTEKERT
jgi:hypothetical protein